ncbi:1,4-dihydroxy-2-naphthoate polyprenyltransferase, partial [Halobacteriales archaeon QH_2_65_14]
LPAGAAPVVIGVSLAVADGVFAPLPAVAALVGALLIQVGTNFANDYYDAVKGADTEDREGFTRVTAGGLIDPEQVKRAMAGTYALALVVGLSSILAGLLYTGGPYPYGYYGLGDFFVFLYFGLVAVTGTYYVQAVVALGAGPLPLLVPDRAVATAAVLGGVAAGGLSTAILVVNNIRDIETDREAGKRTLAVMLGYRWSRAEFVGLVGVAYVVPVVLWLGFDYTPGVLLAFVSFPLAVAVTRVVFQRSDGDALNPALERTGQLFALYALLFATGLVAPGVIS